MLKKFLVRYHEDEMARIQTWGLMFILVISSFAAIYFYWLYPDLGWRFYTAMALLIGFAFAYDWHYYISHKQPVVVPELELTEQDRILAQKRCPGHINFIMTQLGRFTTLFLILIVAGIWAEVGENYVASKTAFLYLCLPAAILGTAFVVVIYCLIVAHFNRHQKKSAGQQYEPPFEDDPPPS